MKILIIGYGSVARKHVKAIWEISPAAEIIALRSDPFAEPIDNIKSINHIDELTDEVDFILISNPTAYHAKTIAFCLSLNKPLFIEKPLFSISKGQDSLVKTCIDKGLITYVACNLRFHPLIHFLKHNLPTGIQEINIYCGSYLPDWRPGRNYHETYSANTNQGGGVDLDLIHEIDYSYWLFGEPLKVSSIKRNVSSLGIHAYDYANYQLIYPTFTNHITLNYYRRDAKRSIEILTDSNTFSGDLLTCKLTDHSGRIIFENPEFNMQQTYLDQMKYFTDCLMHNKPCMNGIEEAYTVLQIGLTPTLLVDNK